MANASAKKKKRPWYLGMTALVLYGMLLGAVFGHFYPAEGIQMKILADAFIKLIKMIIAPLIFLTIVTGIAGMGDLKKVGKVGVKAVVYFEVVTTLALILGMIMVNVLKPGEGFNLESVHREDVSKYTSQAKTHHSFADFMYDIIPDNFLGAFTTGNLLQVLFIAVLTAVALGRMNAKAGPLIDLMDRITQIFFEIIHIVMKIAPLAAFGALAFAVGKFGVEALIPLGKLVLLSIATLAIFVTVVLGSVAAYFRFSLWKLIKYVKDELIIVLGLGSSEPVLPSLMEKLEKAGCDKSVVGLVIPTGYSFNLDGTSIYLAICVMFIAQAFGVELSIGQQLTALGIMMVTSKGAAAVSGAGFIILAGTVQATGFLPIEGLALLLGIDRIMSSVRAVTNVIGNTVATVAVAKWEKEFDESNKLLSRS